MLEKSSLGVDGDGAGLSHRWRLGGIAVLLAVGTFGFASIVRRYLLTTGEIFPSVFYLGGWADTWVIVLYALTWVGLGAVVAYRGGGLFGSLVLVFGALFGGFANDFVLGNICCSGEVRSLASLHASYTTHTHMANTLMAALAALVIAPIFAIPGYLLGTGAKRLTDSSQ